jgi:hypothetical protein
MGEKTTGCRPRRGIADDADQTAAVPPRILAPQVPRSTELQFRPPHRGNLAIHCQEEMETDGRSALDGPGAEAPDSGRS